MNRPARQTLHVALVLALSLGLGTQNLLSEETNAANSSNFARQANTYTVRHEFKSSLGIVDILSICFDFKHLKGFYRGTDARLIDSGSDWQTLEYRIDYKVCKSTATYKKTIDRQNKKIRFKLLRHEVWGWGIPVMTTSSGSYTINENGKDRTIIYEQSVTLEKEISDIDWMIVQRKTQDFFTSFDMYLKQQETMREKNPGPSGKGK